MQLCTLTLDEVSKNKIAIGDPIVPVIAMHWTSANKRLLT